MDLDRDYADDDSMDSMVDDLAREVERDFAGGNDGTGWLDVLVALSAICSAIFFFQYGGEAFRGIWPPLKWGLTLACGLLSTEYAYIVWRNIRKKKQNMTRSQLTFSSLGIISAVGFAVLSTIALFVGGFQDLPRDIASQLPWLALICITVPLPLQFALIAGFELFDRVVVENLSRARIHATKFAALQHFNMARVGALLVGMKRTLARELNSYGETVGRRASARMLRRSDFDPIGARSETPAASPADEDEIKALLNEKRPSLFSGLFRRSSKPAKASVSKSTHDTARHEPATPAPDLGQGELPRLHPDDINAIAAALSAQLVPVATPSSNGQEKPVNP